jgi:nicotinamidase-related amidase
MTSGRDGGVPRSTGAVDSPESFAGWVLPWPRFEVDWRRAALLVIDVQNYSSKVGMGIAQMLAERHPEVAGYYADRIENTMVPNIRRLIDGFRLAGREIIYTRHGPLLPDGRDMIARRRVRDEEAIHATHKPALWPAGSFEHEIIDALRPEIGDLVLDKNASSPFNGTGIVQLLRNLQIDTVVLSGTATEMCVETTARDAGDRGYNVVVAEDATGTYFHAHHLAALSSIARVYGQVWDTDTVLARLGDAFGESSRASSGDGASRSTSPR